MDKLAVIGLILLNTFLAALGMIFLKLGAKRIRRINLKTIISLILNWQIIGGAALYFFGSLIFIWVLTTQDLTYIYPLTAMVYFFIILFSVLFLKEKMNKYKWSGVLLIILGVVIMSI